MSWSCPTVSVWPVSSYMAVPGVSATSLEPIFMVGNAVNVTLTNVFSGVAVIVTYVAGLII